MSNTCRPRSCAAASPGVANRERHVHFVEMSFWKPNIGRRGRIIRAVMTLALCVAARIAHRAGAEWLAIIFAISALVGIIEVARGWCVLRACKIKTRF